MATVTSVVGGLLLVWSAGIHAHLWLSVGYRHIPTIGPLFLLQSVTAVALGALAVVVHRAWSALLGAGFGVATIGGLVVSVQHGLFGFRDSWSAPFATQSLVVEAVAVVFLGIAAGLCLVGTEDTGRRPSPSPAIH